ncbi:hypothetical protein QR680_002163 [Steinernema hermaphroditum]|uniref:Uncharacterized protein n=1 Tax=Steinernema hermaphroditum TaxID=289476 RepID=A0AA39H2G3_9BILA|nr:hypothetical protein QR680_002163 [Steinernema hermaphroditum]
MGDPLKIRLVGGSKSSNLVEQPASRPVIIPTLKTVLNNAFSTCASAVQGMFGMTKEIV